ncbi:MAG: ATP-binding cassette domain-containing protein [Bacteroidetes bacterium]|nr:ATP-binding cassette domain-containing protein [Bacteroidota bacterium]
MIEARNITKKFRDKTILSDFSFTFERGKTNLIIGQSGSGKTVLLKCLVGLHDIDSGEVLYENQDFFKLDFAGKKNIRRQIGMLFQGGALFDSMTVEENVIFPLSMFTDMTKEECLDRANFCLNRVNLVNTNKLFPSEISGGMKKRVAIARAISTQPNYLFCDEPNSGLDPKTSIVIDNLIKELTEEFNMTTVVITHDMNSVIEIGDKIAFIFEGKKRWEGTRTEILSAEDPELVNFVYASKFMMELRKK